MKHTKEFWILVIITIAIPATLLTLYFGGAFLLIKSGLLYGDNDGLIKNDTNIEFNLSVKAYYENETLTKIFGDMYYISGSELENMTFGKRYSCDLLKESEFLIFTNESLSNCKPSD